MSGLLEKFWHGKSMVLTGASSGLGKALIEALAKYDMHFCLLSRRKEKMQEIVAGLQNFGSSFFIRACDVQDRQQVYDAVQLFHQEAKRIDVGWVNSGISVDSSFENWDWQTYENIVNTNLNGAIYTAKACLEIMKQQGGGALVGIGSAASMRGLPRRGLYSMTKIALDYYWQSISVELPEIDFTMIHPGFVDTPINAGNPTRFWLLTPEKAAQIMINAVAKRKRFLIYPFRMNLLYRFVRNIPLPVYEKLARKLINFSTPPRKKSA